MMKAVEVMTRGVITVSADTSVEQAAQLMLRYDISGFPVVGDGGKMVGIITEGDFLRRSEIGTAKHHGRWIEIFLGPGRLADEYAHANSRKIADIMTKDVHTVAEDTPLEAVVALMEDHHIKRVPVTRDGHVIGIISRANLLHALTASKQEPVNQSVSDDEILDNIKREFGRQHWVPLDVKASVENGIVELRGVIVDERHRTALRVLAENTPGVKEVRDRLSWMDPSTGVVFYPPVIA